MLRTKKVLWILMLLLYSAISYAQKSSVQGKVLSSDGSTLPGVNIILKGKGIGSISDANGRFTIAASQGDVLTFSFLGFETKEVVLGKQNNLVVTLQESAKALNEVVVTAMGIKKETKKLGYSVQEVSGDAVTKVRDANPVNALAGKVAGLNIGASTELLGAPQIVLRGSKDLLFVVDGVPVSSDTWNLSPDDIESYSVLKGPNAAALYGSRGINGAIVISTKKGLKKGSGSDELLGKDWLIEFNTTNTLQSGWLTVPQSQSEYGRGTKFVYSYGDQLYDNNQRLPEWGPRFEGQAVKQYDSPWNATTQTRTATPWLARGANNFDNFMQTGLTTTDNIAFSQGGANHSVRISYTHAYQKGTSPNTKLNSDNFSIGGSLNLSKQLTVEGNLNVNVQYTPNIPDVSYGPNSYTYMFKVYGSADYNVNDLKDIYNTPMGVQNLVQYAPEYGRENSAWFMADKWLISHNKTDVYGHLKLTYKITDDLNASFRTQLTTWNQLRTEDVPASANLNQYTTWYYFGWYGDYREDSRTLTENNSDFTLNYNKQLGNWSLSALAGTSMRLFKYSSFYGTTKGLAMPNVYSLSNSLTPASVYTWGSAMQVFSGYYSVDFGYKNYFNISHTGRVDNMSTLPSGNNTYFYPSVSLSSVVNEYIELPKFISLLKPRISFATVKGGLTSSSIGSAYNTSTGNTITSLLGYGSELMTAYDGPTYANQNAYLTNSYYNGTTSVSYSNTIANSKLKPYSRKSLEAGLDIRFLDNRLSFDGTYYRTINGPQIYSLPVAPSTGYSAQYVNGITTLNQGVELSLSAQIIKNQNGFNWTLGGNWSTYRETLQDIYGNEQTLTLNGHDYKKGDRLDAYYGTGFVRDPSNGKIILSNGVPISAPSNNSNKTFLGYLNPDFSFGINNTFSYKNFALSFQFDGRIGGKIYDYTYEHQMNGGTAMETVQGDFGAARYKEWISYRDKGSVTPSYIADGEMITSGTPTYANGKITNASQLTFAKNTTATTVQSYVSSYLNTFDEYWMINRSFAKLREVSLTYTLPKNAL